ncbi:flagellar motor switch protein FliN/FliY [Granulicella aggregans]|uniref:Flagellar motor switch protein FliN/FliY n=1 Tax=Granulicella aggregans TaxID=474949 RepID=A0A7W7ZD73_9BACT|nr:FliM/FliN family flagellar motor C-terminal domain-containing protein [Granulicella aggregans]MBB5057627.1 flagellar motor switch protein FliN/FliY [Granulicella aggregans]
MSILDNETRSGEMAVHHGGYVSNRHHLPWTQRIEDHVSWPILQRVPETITALIDIPDFTVRDLLTLEPGRVVASQTLTSELIPIKIGAVQILWAEFEVVEESLGLRVAKLA